MEREQDRNREADRLEEIAEREREKELEAIKEQYLGSKKPKKRVIKPSEEFLFSFDWENTEDTSRDMNTLYQSPHEARLLFGRGFLAGVDRREQKKVAAQHEKEIRAELRRKAGAGESLEEDDLADKKKAAAADSYDAFDMRVDRHWSEKSAEEMIDRDWRIFRVRTSILPIRGLAFRGRCGTGVRASLGLSCLMLLRRLDTRNRHQSRWLPFHLV